MVENVSSMRVDSEKSNRKNIVFFVKQGLDSFLEDIINGLSHDYVTKKIVVTNLKQIDEGMKCADICWFEWCDELISYGSKLSIAKEKNIICRIHSYESFTEYPCNVYWKNIDKIIFVAEHIRNFTINNFNIDKGPMLLLHTFKAIYDKNNQYKLYIAGKFQDARDVLYFNQMIKEFGLEDNVIYEGWQDNLDIWLEDKNYILCTSILESQNISVMQAMAKGIKPIIHNFVGAKEIYPQCLIWNTINDALEMLIDSKYDSQEYNCFVKNDFELQDQIEKLKALFITLAEIKKVSMIEQPLVTIGITNYNGNKYLSKCVDSFINQTYPNIEILLIDDCSTDGSDEIIRNYEKKHKNIRGIYHSLNSGGASKGIQEIISNAKGKYFQWIACDDFVERDAVYKFVEYLEENPSKDYVFSDFNIVNEDNIIVQQWNYQVHSKEEVIGRIFKSASGIIPMNCLHRLNFFKDNKINWIVYKNNDFSADTLNCLQLIKYNWNYGKVDVAFIQIIYHITYKGE